MDDKTNEKRPSTPSQATADPFRLLVDAVKDYGIFMLDPAGKVSSWNPGAEKIKGYKAEEIVGQHVSCFYTVADVAAGKPQRGLQIALAEGRFEEEGLRLRKDGTPFWAIVTITSIHDSLGRLIGFANITRDITERKQTEAVLQLRDQAIESLVQGLCITDPTQPDNPIVYVNDSFLRITRYAREDVIGRNCRFLQGPETAPEAIERIRSAIRERKSCLVELLNYRKDGTPFWNGLSISPIRDAAGQVVHFVGVQTDISPLKLMEQQFQQAQKMEAVGQLAGGVAHDFNNLLTIITGYSELALAKLRQGDPASDLLHQVIKAGFRAASLTRQLLAFSRKQVLEPVVLNVSTLLADMEKLLPRLVGDDIVLHVSPAPDLWDVKADGGQLEQVIMNVVVNARDAMPQGGKLTIETANIEMDETPHNGHPNSPPGEYVMLAVRDTGCGMDPATKSRIFEPFFTTKGPEKGTGLGLSTAWGIVKQSGGNIEVYSAVGLGTTVNIYLPRSKEGTRTATSRAAASKPIRGAETILLVEDEEGVRSLARLVLQSHGYTVLEAKDGSEALLLAQGHPGVIHLLVSDVVMPNMSGPQLAERFEIVRPAMLVLYISGYSTDAMARHGIVDAKIPFLPKPFTPLVFARKVRDVLDKQRR